MGRRRTALAVVLAVVWIWLALAAVFDRSGGVNWVFAVYFGACGGAVVAGFVARRRRR